MYESQAIMEAFEKNGYVQVPFEDTADVYVINTCTVTQIAARKSRQMIHRARKRNPEAVVVACGCYVDQKADQKELLDIVDLAVSNKDKEHLVSQVNALLQLKPEAVVPEQLFITDTGEHTRAFLKVQDGCRQFCSYCIIPYVRGPLNSKDPEIVYQEAETLAANGCKEIVLTGIHLSSYGRDLEQEVDLGDLIVKLGRIPGLERIRLGSLEVGLITDEFLAKVSGVAALCPHFHLSLQSGCDKTLKAMNRKYTAAMFEKAVCRLRTVFEDVAITTDVICGFPGETEEDHQASYDFVNRIGFTAVHVFPYSIREGTAASRRKDQIDPQVRKRRSAEMASMTEANEVSYAESFIRRHALDKVPVLLEEYNEKGEHWEGYTVNYLRVHVADAGKRLERNSIALVSFDSTGQDKNGTFLVGTANE